MICCRANEANLDRVIFASHYRDDIFNLHAEIGRLKDELQKAQTSFDTKTITHSRPIITCSDCKAKDKTIASLQQELKEKQSTNESLLLRAFTSDAASILAKLKNASLRTFRLKSIRC